MRKTILSAIAIITLGLGMAAHAQQLLYQWTFGGQSDTATNSAPSFAITPGTGSLVLTNIVGNVFTAGLGADGINPPDLFYERQYWPWIRSGRGCQGRLGLQWPGLQRR